jgi:hypothetical protein
MQICTIAWFNNSSDTQKNPESVLYIWYHKISKHRKSSLVEQVKFYFLLSYFYPKPGKIG